MPRRDLFWLALTLAALVALFIVGKLLFAPPPRRSGLWVLALAAMTPPCTFQPAVTWRPEGRAGWSSPYIPLDHKPSTGRRLLQQI